MKRRCCYSHKDMGEKEPYQDKTITHGICDECMDREFGEFMKTPRSKTLEKMNVDFLKEFGVIR